MKLTDFPQKLDLSVYESIREKYRTACTGMDGLAAFIEFGTIPLPGISDMDFIAVVEPEKRVHLPSMRSFTPEEKFALEHMPFMTSTETYKSLRYFDPWLLHTTPIVENGPSITVNEADYDEKGHHILSLYRIFECIVSFVGDLVAIRCHNTVHCREMLEKAKTVEYLYRELHKAGIATDETDPYIDEYKSIRNEWFTLTEEEQEKRIVTVAEHFCESTEKIIRILKDHCASYPTKHIDSQKLSSSSYLRSLEKQYPGSLILDGTSLVIVFTPSQESAFVRTKTVRSPLSGYESEEVILELPYELSALYTQLLFSEGGFAKSVQARTFTKQTEVPCMTHSTLERRIELMNLNTIHTCNTYGAKQPVVTFGIRGKKTLPPPDINLRGQLGGIHDRLLKRLARTPLSCLLSPKIYTAQL